VVNLDSGVAPPGSVEFFEGSTDLGRATASGTSGKSATWTFATASLASGSRALTAAYAPAPANFLASGHAAAPLALAVGKAGTTLAVSAAATPAAASPSAGPPRRSARGSRSTTR